MKPEVHNRLDGRTVQITQSDWFDDGRGNIIKRMKIIVTKDDSESNGIAKISPRPELLFDQSASLAIGFESGDPFKPGERGQPLLGNLGFDE